MENGERTSRLRFLRPIRDSFGCIGCEPFEPTLPHVNYNEFVLGKLNGSGGFGKVYRASMQTNGRTVAVKFLRKGFWKNETARESFLREVNLASRIKHRGVIRYLGYGESPHGGPYLLSEWIDGQTLHAATRPNTERFTNWLIQICQAIEAVHQTGLVHGDLTPSNIMVDRNEQITITDFGFSQAMAAGTTAIIGCTLGFAAPEQIAPSFGSISPKTDLYAIGGLVHWFLFGEPPNAGSQLGDIITETTIDHLPDRSRFASAPQPFQSLLQATLHPSPANRLVSASELVDALR